MLVGDRALRGYKRKIYDELFKRYGNNQLCVASEECSELAKECIKAYRNKLDRNHLVEEMADVLIMIEQVMNIYDIKDIEVIMEMRNKLDRTNERLKEGSL